MVPRRPRASACSRIAAMQKAMCSSRGTPELFGAFADVVAADAFGEGLVFHAAAFTESTSRSRMLFEGRT